MSNLAVAELHRRTDAALVAVPGRTCRGSGCSACCGCDVMAHPWEVRALVPLVSAESWARVEALRPLPYLGRFAWSCPLLDPASGACTVYAQRPAICRAFHSLESPAKCGGSVRVRSDLGPARELQGRADNLLPGGIGAFRFLVEQLLEAPHG